MMHSAMSRSGLLASGESFGWSVGGPEQPAISPACPRWRGRCEGFELNRPGLDFQPRPCRVADGTRHAKRTGQPLTGPRNGLEWLSINERRLMLGTVLVVLLVLMLFGALPTWPHSRNWGYYPSGGLGLVLGILVILLLLGRI